MKTIGHHSVEDRGNPGFVERNAPFLSSGSTAFLGPGYYFWEKTSTSLIGGDVFITITNI